MPHNQGGPPLLPDMVSRFILGLPTLALSLMFCRLSSPHLTAGSLNYHLVNQQSPYFLEKSMEDFWPIMRQARGQQGLGMSTGWQTPHDALAVCPLLTY